MTSTWMRASRRLLLVEAVSFLASFALLLIALGFWASRGSAAASVLLQLAIVVYAPLRLAWIIVRWGLETYRLDPSALTTRTGVFRRQERHLEWSSIMAVDEQAGLLFRLLRIRRVQLTQSDAVAGAVVFRALDANGVAELRRLVHGAEGARSTFETRPHAGTIYRASWRELVLMSIVNGRFALLAPPVLFAVGGLLEDLGVRTWAFELFASLPPLALAALAAAGFILIGTLATISRYQGFEARMSADRRLVLSYGLVEKRERQIELASIEGIVLRRSVIEQLLGRSRLTVLTFAGTDDMGSGLVLPSLPDPIVRQIARSHFAQFVHDAPLLVDERASLFRQLGRIAAVYALPLVIGFVLLETGTATVLAALITLVALGVSTAVGRLFVLRLSLDDQDIARIERRLVTHVETFVRATAYHSVGSLQGRSSDRPLFFSAHVYAGGTRFFAGMRCSAADLRRLRTVVAGVREPAAARQRSLICATGAAI